jgi:hypothetical protein
VVFLLLSSCSAKTASAAGQDNVNTPEAALALTEPATRQTTATELPATLTPIPAVTQVVTPVDWRSWPVLPTVSAELKEVYRMGLENGNDPHAFSIFGDCQSLPDVFLGQYASDPATVAALPDYLQETVRNFSGSFDRYSPTVKSGTTAGALLWEQWNDNKEKKCRANETPVDCELRVHRPSIVFLSVGTHWESRNYTYLTTIVQKIIEHGAVPVLVIKADDRELDERINQDTSALAEEFDLPVWNFWATVQDLPNGGIYTNSTWELTAAAKEIHRLSALEALDAVWRALK